MKPLLKLLLKYNSSQGMNIVAAFLGEKIKKTQQQPNRREWNAAQSFHHFLLIDFLIWLWFQSLELIFPVEHI